MRNLIGRFRMVLCTISAALVGIFLIKSIVDFCRIIYGGEECFLDFNVALLIVILGVTAIVYLLGKEWRCSKCGEFDSESWISKKRCQSCGAPMVWGKGKIFLFECPSGHLIKKDYTVFQREHSYCSECGQLMTNKGRTV